MPLVEVNVIILVVLLVGLAIYSATVMRKVARIRQTLQNLIDALEPIAVLDQYHTIVRVNFAYAQLTGLHFRDLIGKKIWEIFPERFEDDMQQSPVIRAFESGEVQRIPRQVMRQMDGTRVYDVEFHPTRLDGVLRLVEIWKDATSIYDAQEVLEAQKLQLETKTDQLTRANRSLRTIRQQLEISLAEKMEEYEHAQQIQQALLPKNLPEVQGVSFAAQYRPVGLIGGDLYDVVELEENRLGIFIGDVAGHGLPAALVGALVKMAFTVHAAESDSPAAMLESMNRYLLQVTRPEHYLTAFYGVLDLNTYELTYCRGGHPHPLVFRKNGDLIALDSKGALVGALPGSQFEECTVRLFQGDRLFMFTDGCFEVRGRKGQRLRQKDFNRMLAQVYHRDKEDIFDSVIDLIKENVDPEVLHEDDSTLLVMELD